MRAITEKRKQLLLILSNPTRMIYSKKDYNSLEVCLEHDILIVSDEIYESNL
ncbi:aminotransferase class I/II-fold pyridoxal phosphate-dependent enzyme [Bacillus pacificus]